MTTVKVIGVFFTLLCLFSFAFAALSITKAQFHQFQGSDPTCHCGSTQTMDDECKKLITALGVNIGSAKQISGYPKCGDAKLKLQDGEDKVHVLSCAWNQNQFMYVGKGQTSGKYMNYQTDNDGVLFPNEEIKYPS